MKTLKIIFTIYCVAIAFHSMSQTFRYQNSIFNKVDTLKNIEYASAEWLNNPIALLVDYNIHEGEITTTNMPLYMDIFMPNVDTLTKRPAIIFAHSGGFLLGSRLSDDMIAMCDSFARKGYVTATIDYRLGMGASVSRLFGVIIGIRVKEENGYRAFYRGIQDSRAAVRFLKKNAEVYGIDTTKIYFAGSSAGAILSIQNLYLDHPGEILSDAFSPPSLGQLDSIGVQGFGAKASASVALWGAIQNPGFIENESKPIFLVHGTDDNIVPFKKGMPLDGIVPPNAAISLKLPESYGSYCIDTALNNRNIFHETYFVQGKNHEFYGVNTGDFYPEGPNEYWDTIQMKISKFIFSQFQPKANFETEIQNLTARFTNTSSEIYDSNWDFGDGTSGKGNDVSHTYLNSGIYDVQLTSCNQNLACDTITKQILTEFNVLAENHWLNEIKIYPNPVIDVLRFEGIEKSFDVKIFNLDGNILLIQNNVNNKQINIRNLQRGFCIIEISFNNEKIYRKILKQD